MTIRIMQSPLAVALIIDRRLDQQLQLFGDAADLCGEQDAVVVFLGQLAQEQRAVIVEGVFRRKGVSSLG